MKVNKNKNMDKQHKITSFFQCFNKHKSPPINKDVKNEVVDCIVIDSAEKDVKNPSIIKSPEKEDATGSKLPIKRVLFPIEADLSFENDLDDDLMAKTLNKLESQDYKESPSPFRDDTTYFFLKMLEDFLNRQSLHYLFDKSDIHLLNAFFNLPTIEHKLLFVRMYWLQPKWYKTEDVVLKYLKCKYSENKTTRDVVDDLISGRYLLNGSEHMSIDDWMSVLLRPDLLQLCSHFKIKSAKGDKNELINQLKKIANEKSTILHHTMSGAKSMEKVVLNRITRLFGSCIKISDEVRHLFDCLHVIMYLGINPSIIREKRLNLLLINIKNNSQSFPYVCEEFDSLDSVFPSKEDFSEYMIAYNMYEKLFKLTTTTPCNHSEVVELSRLSYDRYTNSNANESLPVWLHSYSAVYRHIKIMEKSLNSYKALKDVQYLNEALKIIDTLLSQSVYRQQSRAMWYEEKALILQSKLKKSIEAANVLNEALNDPALTEESKVSLVDRAKKLAALKSAKLPSHLSERFLGLKYDSDVNLPFIEIQARSTDENFPGRKARYVFTDIISSEKVYSNVEQYAALHYLNNDNYSSAEHWEGRIVSSLFTVLFWDIIYSPVDSAKCIFLSNYQEAPLDLYTNKFYENRKEKIDNRLNDIERNWTIEQVVEFIQDIYNNRKKGEVSIMSDMESSQIVEIAHCLNTKGVYCICKRMAMMYQYAHSGFPDLTIWNIKTKKIKFVEVKGDGDKLSYKQIQWMTYLMDNGIETEVCYVHKGSNKRKTPKKSDKQVKSPKRRKKKLENTDEGLSTPKKSNPKINNNSSPEFCTPKRKKPSVKSPVKTPPTDCYLKSPTKHIKGVGYISPSKSPKQSPDKKKARKRISLSLTRKKTYESDL